jgi:hypothetical protein
VRRIAFQVVENMAPPKQVDPQNPWIPAKEKQKLMDNIVQRIRKVRLTRKWNSSPFEFLVFCNHLPQNSFINDKNSTVSLVPTGGMKLPCDTMLLDITSETYDSECNTLQHLSPEKIEESVSRDNTGDPKLGPIVLTRETGPLGAFIKEKSKKLESDGILGSIHWSNNGIISMSEFAFEHVKKLITKLREPLVLCDKSSPMLFFFTRTVSNNDITELKNTPRFLDKNNQLDKTAVQSFETIPFEVGFELEIDSLFSW